MKEYIKTPEKELNKMEKSNLSDAEFKILVIRMLKELSEDLNSTKKMQSETKDTLTEIKNNLQGNNSRLDEAENQINDLEQKETENIQSEQPEEKRVQKTKDNMWCPQENFKRTIICIIGVSEGEEKEQEIGNLFNK